MDEQRKDFLCKKWILFSFVLLGIISAIVVASLVTSLIDSVSKSDPCIDKVKSVSQNIVIASGVISILIHFLGLMSTYIEHYWLTMVYAILMFFITHANIALAIKISIYGYSTFLYFVITILAFTFAVEIKMNNSSKNQMFANLAIASQTKTHTVVEIVPDYSGQQHASSSGGLGIEGN